MNTFDLSLRDMNYVLALADTRHFGQAAEQCAVSQPALTQQLKKIEATLGTRLFERTKRQVLIPKAAEPLIEQMRRIVEESRHLLEMAAFRNETLSGPFRLGAIATAGPYIIPHLLEPLKSHYPQLQLILQEGYTHDLLHDLNHGELDGVIAALPLNLPPSLTYLPLYFEPFLLAVAKDSALTGKKRITPKDLALNEMLLLEEGNCLRDQTWALCPSQTKGEDFRYHASSMETLLHMVASGLGYSVVPYLAKSPNPVLNQLLNYRAFSHKTGQKEIGRAMVLVYRSRYASMQNIRALAQLIQDTLSPLLPKPEMPDS